MREPATSSDRPSPGYGLWLAAVLGVATFAYYRAFLYRLDYPAHLLAGGALMLLMLAVSTALQVDVALATITALAGVILLALVAEFTAFGESTDAIDIGNSILGAVVVAAAVAAAPSRRAPPWLLGILGLVGLWGSWYLRYHLRYGGNW